MFLEIIRRFNVVFITLIFTIPFDVIDIGTEGFTCRVNNIPDLRTQITDARFQITIKSVQLRSLSLPQAIKSNIRKIPLSHEVPLTGKFLFFSKKEISSLKSKISNRSTERSRRSLKSHLWYGYCVDCGLRPDIVSLEIPVQPATIEILKMYGVTHTPSLVEVTGKELIIYEKDFD
ncbi:MAG: hypothetical protein AB1488_06565 [Nitrospirota bacterium]